MPLDTPTPLVPLGGRITSEAEDKLFRLLEDGEDAVLLREYASINTATTAAFKLNNHKKWAHEAPAGCVVRFFTRTLRPKGPYGVWARFVSTRKARTRG